MTSTVVAPDKIKKFYSIFSPIYCVYRIDWELQQYNSTTVAVPCPALQMPRGDLKQGLYDNVSHWDADPLSVTLHESMLCPMHWNQVDVGEKNPI